MLKAIHRMQRDERGFTLVELLIVVAIIAILAAIAIPQFAKYRQSASKAACQSDVRNCVSMATAEYANNVGNAGNATCTASSACNSGATFNCSYGTDGNITTCNLTGNGSYTGTCSYNVTAAKVDCN